MNLTELKAELEKMLTYLNDAKVHLDPYDAKETVHPDWPEQSLLPDLSDIERRIAAVTRQRGNVIHE